MNRALRAGARRHCWRSCGRVGGGDVTVWLQPSGGCSWIRRGCLCRIDIEAGYDDLGAGLQRDEHAARCEMWP